MFRTMYFSVTLYFHREYVKILLAGRRAIQGNRRFLKLSVVLKYEIHTANFKRSSNKEMNTFHVALRTIRG